jgi:membrane-bound lytic murein transglycosylase A
LILCLILLTHTGCGKVARIQRDIENSSPFTIDSLPESSLRDGIRAQIKILSRQPEGTLQLGPKVITVQNYISGLMELLSTRDHQELLTRIFKDFELVPAGATNSTVGILITGYFEPMIEGSRRPTKRFSQPIYSLPEDLLTIDLNKFPGSPRLRRTVYGRLNGQRVVPYLSRKEIDELLKLKGRGLEIAYADPLEVFFLQIQGSGTVRLPSGKILRLNFAGKNGHPYRPIGKLFRHIYPLEELGTKTIVEHLKSLSPEDRREILNYNPSYVFFRRSDKNAVTATGAEAVAERTIATDPTQFEKGVMGYLAFDDQKHPPRIVFDQDVGGAIKGPTRIDLFMGQGSEAGAHAGELRSRGRYFYLVPR